MPKSVASIAGMLLTGLMTLCLSGCGADPGEAAPAAPPSGGPGTSAPPAPPAPPAPGGTTGAAPLAVSTISLPAGSVHAFYSVRLQSRGGIAPVTWALAGTLPAGMSLDPAGLIAGTPTAAGSTDFAVTATDSGTPVQQVTQALNVAITAADASHNSTLKGRYAFVATGYRPLSPRFFPVRIQTAIGMSFIADGNGNVTSVVIDTISPNGLATTQAADGFYVVGSDNRGVLGITTATGTASFRFSVGSISAEGIATKGRVVSPSGEAGELDLQDPAAFTNGALGGSFAFGLAGAELNRAFGANGVIGFDGAGNIPAGRVDVAHAAGFSPDLPVTGTYFVGSEDAGGRGTAKLLLPATTLDMILYVVSANKVLLLGTQQGNKFFAFTGEAHRQSQPTFDAGSLRGTSVLAAHRGSSVVGGIATFDGTGGVSFLEDRNDAGRITLAATSSGTYLVSGEGHAVLTIAGSVVSSIYLVEAGAGFLLYADSRSGLIERQAAGSFSASSLEGTFALGSLPPPVFGAVSGVANASTGTFQESIDVTRSGAPPQHVATTDSFTVASNGRVTTASGLQAMYLVSPRKLVLIDLNPVDDLPGIMIAEQ